MKRLLVDARNGHGKPGAAAPDYPPGSAPSGTGRHGSTGQPGLPGEAGQAGGVIEAQLVWDEQAGAITFGQSQGEGFRLNWDPQETEEILLTARGGDGGRGGRGGRGQNGSQGSRGSNATRYSSGGNGGSGGAGGRGGSSGQGGPAGAGGQVSLSVSSEDSDLLLAVRWDVSAGTPGPPGQPGEGGSGGPGGSGGSSYSWTETETYTDSQGKSQTRTVYRSNPGGSDGPRGPKGATGITAEPGARAEDGQFTLTIEHRSYSDRYRLKCHSYDLISGDGDDIFEFGERDNRVLRTVVKNVGPAPSPPLYLHSELSGGPELTPGGEHHPLSTLEENQESVLPDFSFHLAEAREDQLPTIHRVLSVPLHLSPEVFFTRLHRRDPEFVNPRLIHMTFPVELITVASSTSLTYGGVNKQQWEIVNRSNREFPPPGRKLLVDLSLRGEGAQLKVSNENRQTLELGPEERLFSVLEAIPPGGRTTLTAYLEVEESSEPYSKATLTASLRLTPQGGGPPRIIQRNPTQYSVALAHENRPADVMLVTHHGSSAQEVKNWGNLLSQLKLTWNVWDLSLYGRFPLMGLSDYYRGKLVVVLNTPFLTPRRQTILPTELMDFNEFRHSLADAGFSFYFIGEESRILNHLVPRPELCKTYSSPSHFLKTGDFFERRANPEVPGHMNAQVDKIQISRFFLRGVPQPEYLRKRAHWLLEQLKKKLPQERFHITTIFQPDDSEGWLKTRDCGVLEVRRLPDRDARAVVTRQVYRETGQTSEFLFSAENLLGLFSAQDFDDKLALLSKLKAWPQPHLEALADAILMDLSEEQMDLRSSGVRLNTRKLREALNRTVDFCGQDLRDGAPCVDLDSELGRVLVRIVAGLQFLAEHQMAWWDHRIRFLGGSNDVEVSLFVQKFVDQFLDRNFGPDRIWGSPAARVKIEEAVKARLQELESQRASLAEVAGVALSKKATAVEALVRWELRDYLESDAMGESMIWNQEEMEELAAREQEHLRRRAELLAVYEQALEASRVGET